MRAGTADRAEPRRPLRVWILVAAVLGLAVVAVLARPMLGRRSDSDTKSGAAGGNGNARGGEGRDAHGAGGAPKTVPVLGAKVTVGDLGLKETGLGTVVPIATVVVRSRVDGQLVRLHYKEGQRLKEGDLLAEIDPRPFQVQLMQAEGQQAKDEAALSNARLDLDRYKVLLSQDSVSRQQLDTQAAVVSQAEATVKSDQAQVEAAKLNLTYCRITAPITGVVGLRLVDQGNMVHANDANGLAVMTQQQPIAVTFTIPADHLPPVLERMKTGAKLPVEAWDRDLKNKLATGEVLAVDNQIDPTTGTVKIKARFDNENLALYPNQFVNASMQIDTLKDAVLAPTAAIERGPQSAHVYVVKPDSTVELREVALRATEGEVTAVQQGLSGGETVVIDGLDKLQPGAAVALTMDTPHSGNGTAPPTAAAEGPSPAAGGSSASR
jgi:multidrug efflux system membrane fusion protein